MPVRSQLARLLRRMGYVQAVAALAWLAFWASRAPALAWTGFVLLLLLAPIVLAIEFALLALVARGDRDVPDASPAQLLRAWLGETRQLFQVFYWRQPLRWREVDDYLPPESEGRTGVVLLHGFMCNRGFWAPWMRRLRERGVPHIAVNLEPVFGEIDANGDCVEEAVRRLTALTGKPPVLVCHSMGGLAARSWLRTHGAANRLQHVVTIASPHHGTWLGRFSRRPNGRQMRLDSGWLRGLQQHESAHPRPPWTCWYTNCDNIVFPPSTARLEGADNRFVPGRAHVDLAFAPEVMDHTLSVLSR
ncbi:alpha/beta fold hydrolase [Ramlibacter sp. XY19]|uniref:esterase/lipase family protein n=1 Tax=Ramlibacter paludis TaxID=2908000 RepID=UPI0023DB5503|nr:alpha/beta fold hydrolase [Ramlibacter paludis]MCG2591610.1 alpha/beta fold hydrolase [Ramlibacter paludis]